MQSIIQTTDGGYVLAGYTTSGLTGDITENLIGDIDVWIAKTDSLGILQWDERHGGNAEDGLFDVFQTSDGGYILGGYTYSGVSVDVSQPNYGVNPSCDFWMLKTDASGKRLWDKRFGGNSSEWIRSIEQTADGGYILGGYTQSNMSGTISEPTRGLSDYWMVKTDALGNELWDKRFGGNFHEFLYDIHQASDGGYILCGYTQSDSSGDISEPTRGSEDFWLVKTDSLGNKQWDKRFGGMQQDRAFSVGQAADGGFALAGYSYSDSTGDVSQHTRGGSDYWLVRTDVSGNKMWDRRYGGNVNEDEFGKVIIKNDGSFLLSGTSYAQASGDKTENNLGQENIWIIRVDSLGNKIWDKTIFTTGHEESGSAIPNGDSCYVIANHTQSGIGGYKTQTNWGIHDMWFIKMCDTTVAVTIKENENYFPVTIYPNPVENYFELQISNFQINKRNELKIFNCLGKQVLQSEIRPVPYSSGNPTFEIDVSHLSSGIYFLRINLNGDEKTIKIVKL